jgi:rfaE bifunctional protein nucleotidyltransferase chain/domain
MARVVDLEELETSLTGKRGERIVLAGGCFDILHVGHVRFLSEAKEMGDHLIVLLESDRIVEKLKGRNRPVFIQKERAEMLSALRSVDLVVLLPMMEHDSDYLDLVKKIKPDVIAVTENDPHIEEKRRQAKEIGGELRIVSLAKAFSTSKLARIVGLEQKGLLENGKEVMHDPGIETAPPHQRLFFCEYLSRTCRFKGAVNSAGYFRLARISETT